MSREYQISVNFAKSLEVFDWLKKQCFENGQRIKNQNALIIGILEREMLKEKREKK